MADNRLEHSSYLVRKKVLKLIGGAFHVYNPLNEVVFYASMKAFKLKEDIKIYTGEDMSTGVLSIQARKIIDFSSAYDVFDLVTNERIGALKRKGLKSMIKDEWIIADKNDYEIGLIKEDSIGLAILRRFLTGLIPQKFIGEISGVHVCTFKQNFSPLVTKVHVDFHENNDNLLDKRLGIAAAILLCAIEGKQE
jgi:uncharacterized protein YxjI